MLRRFFFSLILLELLDLSLSIKREILVSPYDPIDDCSLDDPTNPAHFKGIEVNILRQALASIGWTEGQDYYFNCTYYEDIFVALEEDPVRPGLLGAIGGITISVYRMDQGFRFSQPTFTTGISVLYYYQPEATFYLRTFSVENLVRVICLPLLVGIIMYFFESQPFSVINYMFNGLGTIFKVDDIVFLTNASRLIGLSLKILLMVTMTLYVAFTTNLLNEDNSFGGITDVYSLAGRRLYSLDINIAAIQSLNALYGELPWNIIYYTSDFVDYIVANQLTYVVYDDPMVELIAYTHCNFYTALKNFNKFDLGLITPSSVDAADEELINHGLVITFSNKTQQEFVDEHLHPIQPSVVRVNQSLGWDISGYKMLWGSGTHG